ncbi:amino acid adenylation domain-containing protein [Flavitalea sp. BT771]|uniref:amino acid adenylation domain-containing protein n=1 Tax=Flavitalea sp. BT771 TaxID=3063329 RepID=UPI0026E368FB|nr:amino acid adenylation domain-containing protein [Flavitalea sp. BT771]MDO6435717.1 amino acid adenylation domain-containing protein [Flavitalea sp. BT771]MDV6224628.1 amino acid adenylation domain-containing protein [Flavitalea sp. BT771]
MLTKDNIQDICALAPMQEAMFLQFMLDHRQDAYFEQVSFRQRGDLNITCVENAFNKLFQRYDILRSVFKQKDIDRPLQIILKERKPDFFFLDIRRETDKHEYLRVYRAKDKLKGFDIGKDVLMRMAVIQLEEKEFEIIWSWHHILLDAWCIGLLKAEFAQIYYNDLLGKQDDLPAVTPYKAYFEWLGKQDRLSAELYWTQYLKDLHASTHVPNGRHVNDGAYSPERAQLLFDEAISGEVYRLTAASRVTMNNFMHAVWGVLLGKYNNTGDVVFGSVVSGRPPEIYNIDSMVGLFINTVPARMKYDDTTTFYDLMRSFQENSYASSKHAYFPLSRILGCSAWKNNLFDHIFLFQHFPAQKGARNGQREGDVLNLEQTDAFQSFFYNLNVFAFAEVKLYVEIKFNRNVYEEAWIRRVLKHFRKIVLDVVRNPAIPVGDIQLMDEEEKAELLKVSVSPDVFPVDTHFFRNSFEWQAHHHPDSIALVDGEHAYTYREVNEKANGLALYLKKQYNVVPGNVIAVLAERSGRTIIALLAVVKLGAAFLPVEPGYPAHRKSTILHAGKVDLLLADFHLLQDIQDEYSGSIFSLDIQLTEIGPTPVNPPAVNDGADMAYMLFTSGSTGVPKGIAITYASFMNYICWANKYYFSNSKGHHFPFYTPLSFDLTLTSIFTTLARGDRLYIFGDDGIDRTLRKIFESKEINCIKMTPSHAAVLKYVELLHGSMATIIIGGEALDHDHVSILRNIDKHSRIFNEYGPTEATIGCSVKEIGGPQDRISIGNPIANARTYILDDEMELVPEGLPGEIHIGGIPLAACYAGDHALTERLFVKDPYNTGGRLYKTGDLAKWYGGEMEFLGRKDDQVKIRGHRCEPGEIKEVLLQRHDITDAHIAAANDQAGSTILLAFVIAGPEADTGEILQYLSSRLPDHLIPARLVRVAAFPLTANGKVDHRALMEASDLISDKKERIAPRNAMEQQLSALWSEILGVEDAGIRDNFFVAGGHSLNAVQLVSRIQKEMGVSLSLKDLFDGPTIEQLALLVDGSDAHVYEGISPCPEVEYYELSHPQKRLWIQHQLDKENCGYNNLESFPVSGLDEAAFEKAFQRLIERHEVLRTTFHMAGGEPGQKIHSYAPDLVTVRYFGSEERPLDVLSLRLVAQQEVQTPFDLSTGPLIRAAVVRVGENEHICLVTVHHIISDGWSTEILLNEFRVLYKAFRENEEDPLPSLRVQYKDFAYWQNRKISATDRTYWNKALHGPIGLTRLPYDYARQEGPDAEGESYFFQVEGALYELIKRKSLSFNTTLSNIILAVYFVLIKQLSDQDIVHIGIAHANRDHPDLDGVVGFFVNILVIRIMFADESGFDDVLQQVNDTLPRAFAHAHYPFELLVEEKARGRLLRKTPIINVSYSFQNFRDIYLGPGRAIKPDATGDPRRGEVPGPDEETNDIRLPAATTDLHLIASDRNDRILFRFEFNNKAFSKNTVKGLAERYVQICRTLFEHDTKQPI